MFSLHQWSEFKFGVRINLSLVLTYFAGVDDNLVGSQSHWPLPLMQLQDQPSPASQSAQYSNICYWSFEWQWGQCS